MEMLSQFTNFKNQYCTKHNNHRPAKTGEMFYRPAFNYLFIYNLISLIYERKTRILAPEFY